MKVESRNFTALLHHQKHHTECPRGRGSVFRSSKAVFEVLAKNNVGHSVHKCCEVLPVVDRDSGSLVQNNHILKEIWQ